LQKWVAATVINKPQGNMASSTTAWTADTTITPNFSTRPMHLATETLTSKTWMRVNRARSTS